MNLSAVHLWQPWNSTKEDFWQSWLEIHILSIAFDIEASRCQREYTIDFFFRANISLCDNGPAHGHCASTCLCLNSTPCRLYKVVLCQMSVTIFEQVSIGLGLESACSSTNPSLIFLTRGDADLSTLCWEKLGTSLDAGLKDKVPLHLVWSPSN